MKPGKMYHTHPFGFRLSAAAVQGGAVIAAGFLAGIVNGLLGTGGGIILLLILRQFSGKDRKNAFAASLFCILPLSVLSLLLYIGSGDVMKAVRRYLACAENLRFKSEYIFLNRWGAPLSCQSVRYMVNKYANLAGIQRKVTPHTFRHT